MTPHYGDRVDPPDPLLGQQLGDYELRRMLGKGGMGVVYEAVDLALERSVALKVLRPEIAQDQKARRRFQREIELAVAVEHPNIVPVYAAGYEPPFFYIAMRMIPGTDLAGLLRRSGALPEEQTLTLLGQIASALGAIHSHQMVHRDIKPHNVLLWSPAKHEEHALLTDFGIAKAADDSATLTGVGAIGTPAYMAPEICRGEPATPASDQYSLGCTAYEMLTGDPPFEGEAAAVRDAHVHQEPARLRIVAPHVSVAVADALDRALAKDPADRFPDVRELARAAAVSSEALSTTERISKLMTSRGRPEEVVGPLSMEHGLSDQTISAMTDMDHSQVVRLRRQHARRKLVGL